MREPEPRQRFLDQPYVLQIVALEQIQDLLRPLARDGMSPLPLRMRQVCAKQHRKLEGLVKELRRHPEAVAAERAAEEAQTMTPTVLGEDTQALRDLAAAVLRQALADVRSPKVKIRRQARRFWADVATVRLWGEVLGIEDVLLRYAAQVVRR